MATEALFLYIKCVMCVFILFDIYCYLCDILMAAVLFYTLISLLDISCSIT